VPEVNRERGGGRNLGHFLSFVLDLAVLALAMAFAPGTWSRDV